MAKQKRKRNKKYTGADAAMTRPSITKVQAVSRSRSGQWWHEHRKIVRRISITALVALVIVWLLIELIRVIANA